MEKRERRFRRLQIWYRLFAGVMLASLSAILAGIATVFALPRLGAGLIAYGAITCVVFMSFFFISRSRYARAKLAHDAHLHAAGRSRRPANNNSSPEP